MFFALTSRSCRVRQDGHVQCLVVKLGSASRCPHAEQVLELGYQRPVTIRCRPALAALYSSIWRKVPHPQSQMALARDRFRIMLFTARSSITITSWSRTRAVEVRCRKSVRDARTFRCARATFALALTRFRRTALAAGQPPLVAGQVLFPAGQLPRVGDLHPAGGDGEILDAQVHAGHGTRRGKLAGAGHLDGERNVPASAWVTGNGRRGWVNRCRVNAGPRPGERQRRVHLGQEQPPVAVPEPGPGVLRGLTAGPGLVAWVAGPLGEEVGAGDLLVPDRLLHRDRRHLVQPGQVRVALHGGQVGVGLGEARLDLLGVVPLVPPCEGPVPDDADAAERAVEHAGLLRCRVRPALVRRPHNNQASPIAPFRISATRGRGSGVSSPA